MGLLELALKMMFCLLLAGLIGWIIGFLLGRIFGSANATELLSDCEGRMRVRDQELKGLRADLSSSSHKIGSLETEVATLATTLKTREGWVTELEAKNKELTTALEARISELDELRAESDKARTELSTQFEATLATSASEVESLRTRLINAENGVKFVQQGKEEICAMQAALQERDAELVQLRKRFVELEGIAGEAQQVGAQVQGWETRYLSLEREKNAEIGRQKVRITELELMMRDVKEPTVKVSVASAMPASSKERDDLKKIFGIGPVLEKLLNSHGIYWFRQIAKWTPEDIRHYDHLLEDFPGRIERDHWIVGAKAEHQKKYGEMI